jgi:hypothetical protein
VKRFSFSTIGLFCAFAIVCSASCGQPTQTDQSAEIVASEKARKREKLIPFPEAVSVRLFATKGDGLSISPTGQPTTKVITTGGVKLTAAETIKLRSAFNWSTPPFAMDACCIPRHAFSFYDREAKFLGSISVCFECSCAESNGLTAPPDMTWIEWDRAKLAEIVEAHGLKTEF